MTKTNLTAGSQDGGGGFYVPRGINNEIDETKIIWVGPGEPIPEGYIQVPEAHKNYLGAWLISFLNRNNADPFDLDFDDQKTITGRAPGGHSVSDVKPQDICIRVKGDNHESITFISRLSLFMIINFHKKESSYDRNKLNSIVRDIKNLKSGGYEILRQNNDYIIRPLDVWSTE